jgi:hypothetical protein
VSLDVEPIVSALASVRGETSAMKTSTMTFAVFHEDEQLGAFIDTRTRVLADKHPSRVLIFDGRQDSNDHRIAPGDERGEWIEIGALGASGSELATALTALEIPAAPVVLLWGAERMTGDERFLALAEHANAVICSSSLTHPDGEGLRDLVALTAAHPEIMIHDVSYLRLGSWQELIAEFFDDPAHRSDLFDLQSVDVTAGSDAEMYYILGWLASRLGWTPQAAGRFARDGGAVEYSMHREGTPRRLSRIVLHARSASYTASVHPQDEKTICLEVSGRESTTRCAPLHSVDLASLVERAILEGPRDEVFFASMTMAGRMLDRQAA